MYGGAGLNLAKWWCLSEARGRGTLCQLMPGTVAPAAALKML